MSPKGRTTREIPWFLLLLFAFPLPLILLAGCESPAATKTIEITIREVNARDVERGQIVARTGIAGGTCDIGPCVPLPCTEQGRTRCVAMGALYRCECNAGTHEEGGQCVVDEECREFTCNGAGECSDDGGISCACDDGYAGTNCQFCDESAGFRPDGFGGCSQEVDLCRAGEGAQEFAEFMQEAEDALGHPPSEIELVSAKLEVGENVSGVRAWTYLFSEAIELFVEADDEFPILAGVSEVPDQEAGLDSMEFQILLDRPTFSRDQKFFDGEFSVGVRAPTERFGNETFTIDLKLTLDVAAY